MTERSRSAVVLETLLVGLAGGAVAWGVGRLIGAADLLTPIGAANGALAGRTRIYDWRSRRGWVSFLVDSSWALIGTAVALVLHLVQAFHGDPKYRFDLSHRANLHVYEGGFSLKPTYAFSVGNIVSNAGGKVGLDGEGGPARRWRFIRNHEFLHVYQNRLFGPLFQISYLGWMLFGVFWGTFAWVRYRRDFGQLVETAAYFNNPFEYWAYVRDDYWPPRDAHPQLVWGAKRMTRSPKSG